jgi:hypothetical protein
MNYTNDLIRRLATSQARGHRQASFVNELLTFRPVSFEVVPVPGPNGSATALLGRSRLSWKSWVNLRRRLVAVGFVVVLDQVTKSVTLFFPETEK